MTLAGTRPILQDELLKYELHHRARIAIKPGITGMWQVSGRSDITDFEEVVRLDTEYISNWNFGLDIKILFKTVMTVVNAVKRGAFMFIKLHLVKDYEVRKVLWQERASTKIKPYLKYKDTDEILDKLELIVNMDSSEILQMKLNALNKAKHVFSEDQYFEVTKLFLKGKVFDGQQ